MLTKYANVAFDEDGFWSENDPNQKVAWSEVCRIGLVWELHGDPTFGGENNYYWSFKTADRHAIHLVHAPSTHRDEFAIALGKRFGVDIGEAEPNVTFPESLSPNLSSVVLWPKRYAGQPLFRFGGVHWRTLRRRLIYSNLREPDPERDANEFWRKYLGIAIAVEIGIGTVTWPWGFVDVAVLLLFPVLAFIVAVMCALSFEEEARARSHQRIFGNDSTLE